MNLLLYHSFPRGESIAFGGADRHQDKPTLSERAISTLRAILRDGLLLAEENVNIPWDDPFGSHLAEELSVRQFRFCLTAIRNDADLLEHCRLFGPISISFRVEFIRQLGGFPVFYLPAPLPSLGNKAEMFDSVGISLIYRMAEARAVLENVARLPEHRREALHSSVSDYSNLLGAMRFLGNIIYLTEDHQRKEASALQFYRQHEWRVIAGLCSPDSELKTLSFRDRQAYLLQEFQGKAISNWIEEIVVIGGGKAVEAVHEVVQHHGFRIAVRSL